ncbi:MAG: hypothetical protein JNL41_07095 [Phenylobacterium sp.]|uniref:hypothetical protein n=1 Tax=Phenylobacterium sp. TaxID=1871053 RepID=UPI001A49B84C|nr:hypothetical protein [Phenylobacterium sp.]MBL8554027.1 hypothetical protein [Phenylobacterium sp.]
MKTGNHPSRDALRRAVLIDMADARSEPEIMRRHAISRYVLNRLRGEFSVSEWGELMDRCRANPF